MKKISLALLLIPVLFTGIFAQNVPNGGFEEWGIGDDGTWDPVNWETLNLDDFTNVWQVEGRTGESAARMSVEWQNSLQMYFTSMIFYKGTFPINEKYTQIECYYKGTSVEGDSLTLLASVWVGETMIGYGISGTNTSTDEWTRLTTNIDYFVSGQTPDLAFVVLHIPPSDGLHYGTEYIIDDLLLTKNTGISDDPRPDPYHLAIAPNPCRENAFIEFSLLKNTHLTLTLMDIHTRPVAQLATGTFEAGEHRIEVRLDDLDQGIYFCRLSDDQGNAVMKKVAVMR